MISRIGAFALAVTVAAQPPALPPEFANVAKFLNIEHDVAALLTAECAGLAESTVCLGARSRVVGALLLAQLELSTIGSVLDREEKRALQRADALTRQLGNRVKSRTVWLILIGAGGAALAASFGSDKIALGTAAAEGVLGVATLRLSEKEEFRHPMNPLREFWLEDRSGGIFPPGVWSYLERPSSDGTRTIRQELLDTWAATYEIGQPTPEGGRLKSLLLGDGGIYTPDDLRVRASMLDQLHTTLSGVVDRLVLFQKNLLRPHELPARQ